MAVAVPEAVRKEVMTPGAYEREVGRVPGRIVGLVSFDKEK
jgi:hypothetical protein